jgi:NCS2 family nucleobase:cation symporter-2
MMRIKPANLIYSVEDTPPIGVSLVLAIQHLLIAIVYLVYPVMVVTAAGGPPSLATFSVQMSMLGIGIGTILQVRNQGPIGSGFLIPNVTTASYLAPSFIAAQTGGMGLVFCMTAIAGFFEGILSQFMKKLRVLFPPVVSGVVVTMTGFSLAKSAILSFVGIGGTDKMVTAPELFIGCITLGVMVASVVWSKGRFRLYSAAIGLGIGYALSIVMGIFDGTALSEIAAAPLIALPSWEHPGLKFDAYLLPTFIIAALASAVKASGLVITCQKVNEPEWKRADMESVGKGMFADGIGCMASGLLGGFGTSMSSANVGLSMATGATSRKIGYFIGVLFIFLVFFPKFSTTLTLMPLPVMGAGLLYVASYLIATGMQLIVSRLMDTRRTFIVGLSFLAGISLDIVPGIYENLPTWASPIMSSSLTVATLVAFVLNLIFRIGVSQKETLQILPGNNAGMEIFHFLDNQGAVWGARPQVIQEAKHVLRELAEAIINYNISKGPVNIDVSFDEYNLNMQVTYKGQPMEFPQTPPSADELMNDKTALAKMSGFMIQFTAEKVTVARREGLSRIDINITH